MIPDSSHLSLEDLKLTHRLAAKLPDAVEERGAWLDRLEREIFNREVMPKEPESFEFSLQISWPWLVGIGLLVLYLWWN